MALTSKHPQATERLENLALWSAMGTLFGSLFLSLGMGLNACPLCFYQRTFIMAVTTILGLGRVLRLPVAPGTFSLVALPLALSGWGVAAVHSALVWSNFLACPDGLFGWGPAPVQSLIAFSVVVLLLLPSARLPSLSPASAGIRLLFGVTTAILLTWLSVVSSPPAAPFNPKYDASGTRLLKSCERAKPESDTAIPSRAR